MRTSTFAALAAATLLPIASAIAAPVIACKGDETNLQTYLKIHKVLFMDRDATRVEEFYAPEVISHNSDAGGAGVMQIGRAHV